MPRFRCSVITASFLALMAILGGLVSVAYRQHRVQVRERSRSLFQSILPRETTRLAQWRREREADLSFYAQSPSAQTRLARLLAAPRDAAARRALERWFSVALAGHAEYLAVVVCDSAGRTLWSLPADAAPPPPELAVRLSAGREPVWGELRAADGKAVWELAAPIPGGSAAFRVDASRDALPSMHMDPLREAGGLDFLLARLDERGAVVLDHDAARPERVRSYRVAGGGLFPRILSPDGEQAVLGADHLGRSVFASATPLPGSGWQLVAMRDAQDALGAPKRLALLHGLMGGLAVSLTFLLIYAIVHHRDAQILGVSARLEALAALGPDPVFVVDKDGRFLEANEAACSLYGYSREEFLAMRTVDLRPPEQRALAGPALARVLTQGVARFDILHRKRDGSTFPVELHARSLPGDGEAAVQATVRDMSAWVAAQERLERLAAEHRRVSRAVECAAESVVITDASGRIEYVNPAFCRVTGLSREEAVGSHTRTLKSGVHPPSFYSELWRTIASGRVWSGRLVNKNKAGALFEEDASIAPVKDELGRITNYVAVKKDVTKELSLENQLLQSQKLEAVGRLAGGVAHDFNNILTAILGYSHLALQTLSASSPLRDDLAEIEKGARRAADLTRQLLIFSRRQVIQPVVLDPAAVVAGLQKMLRRIVGEDVTLRFVSETKGVRILADPGQLEQVVLNFVVNSRDALPQGGEVEVAVREARLAEPVHAVDGLIPPGAYAVLSVRDNGPGIPPATLPRIFEPFFTTKPAGQGTGLGLSTVYGIVKQGGAYLTVDTAQGVGTVMSVFWPAAEGAEEAAEPPAPETARGGSERVLLVEDEPAVLVLTRRLLENAGYAVTAFAEAAPALAWANGPGAEHDLLLTDVVLPGGFGGKALADALKVRRPGLRVLYTSGYSDDAVSHHGVLNPGTRLLPKPYSEEALLRAVRSALDGGPT